MEKSKMHIDKQKAFECRAIQPVLESLKIDESFVDYDGERPDIRFKYDGKNIGVEVIDCYPSKFDIKTHKSVENFCKDIENTLSAKGLCGEYNLYLKDSIYNVKINDIKKNLISDIEHVIKGGDLPSTSFVDFLDMCTICIYKDRLKLHLRERCMRIIQTPELDDILKCINKKNKLLKEYKRDNLDIDEFWLLIYIPSNENYHSITGIDTLENVDTEYKRIYVSDYYFRQILIYEK